MPLKCWVPEQRLTAGVGVLAWDALSAVREVLVQLETRKIVLNEHRHRKHGILPPFKPIDQENSNAAGHLITVVAAPTGSEALEAGNVSTIAIVLVIVLTRGHVQADFSDLTLVVACLRVSSHFV